MINYAASSSSFIDYFHSELKTCNSSLRNLFSGDAPECGSDNFLVVMKLRLFCISCIYASGFYCDANGWVKVQSLCKEKK